MDFAVGANGRTVTSMRLIDGDELLTAFPVDDEPMLTKSCVRMTIRQMPTVDAVPVVRCKDCRYWSGRKYNVHINGFLPWCGFSALQREANDYCSYGRRRGGDADGV